MIAALCKCNLRDLDFPGVLATQLPSESLWSWLLYLYDDEIKKRVVERNVSRRLTIKDDEG